jgi:hypothetical protein
MGYGSRLGYAIRYAVDSPSRLSCPIRDPKIQGSRLWHPGGMPRATPSPDSQAVMPWTISHGLRF